MSSVESFHWNQFVVNVERQRHRRRMVMQVKAADQIRILVNHSTPDRFILEFLKAKSSWLEKSAKVLAVEADRWPSFDFQEGQSLFILGQARQFQIKLSLVKKPFWALEESAMILFLPIVDFQNKEAYWLAKKTQLIQLWKKWAQDQARKLLTDQALTLSQQLELIPSQLRFKVMKGRWGSCSSQKEVTLNLRLWAFPLSVISYVIAHELCHLKYMNHSNAYWGLVEAKWPSYLESEKFLKQNGRMADNLFWLKPGR